MVGWKVAAIIGACLVALLVVLWDNVIDASRDHAERITRIEEKLEREPQR